MLERVFLIIATLFERLAEQQAAEAQSAADEEKAEAAFAKAEAARHTTAVLSSGGKSKNRKKKGKEKDKQSGAPSQGAAGGTTQVVKVKPRRNLVRRWGMTSAFRALVYTMALSKKRTHQPFKSVAQEMYEKTEEYLRSCKQGCKPLRPTKPRVNLCWVVKRENFQCIATIMERVTEFQDFTESSRQKQMYNNKRKDFIDFLAVFVGCELAETMYSETLLILTEWDTEDEATTTECSKLWDEVLVAWARHWYMPDPRLQVYPRASNGEMEDIARAVQNIGLDMQQHVFVLVY